MRRETATARIVKGWSLLGIADRVLLEQLAPEQLGVGQRPRQRRVDQRDVVPVAAPIDGLVDVAPAGADEPPEHDVGRQLVGRVDQPLQRLEAEIVVGTEEEHEAAGGHVERAVARAGRAARVGLGQHGHRVGITLGPAAQLGATVVGGPVVDGDDLEPLHPDRLPEH
jgi:hypothetical protein